MPQVVKQKEFRELPASYFQEKAKKVSGPNKLLVMLEMNKYIRAAREHGLSLEELEKAGFKFATLPDIKN